MKRYCSVPMLAVGGLWCAATMQTETAAPADPIPRDRGFSVVSVNMAKESDCVRILEEWKESPSLRGADFLLLQEVAPRVAARMASELGMYLGQGTGAAGAESELAILSRSPLAGTKLFRLPEFRLGFRSRHRFAITAIAMTRSGPVRIFDTHLDTRLNSADRMAQLAPVLDAAARSNGPTVIGGDFNSNGFYWLGHVLPIPGIRSQADSVWEVMRAHGFRTTIPVGATTFDYLGMHLDWIWARGMQVGESAVYPLRFSDHHAITTRLSWQSLAATNRHPIRGNN